MIHEILLVLTLYCTTSTLSKEYRWEHRTGYASGPAFEYNLGYTISGSKENGDVFVSSEKLGNKVSTYKYNGGTWAIDSESTDITSSVVNDLDAIYNSGSVDFVTVAVRFCFEVLLPLRKISLNNNNNNRHQTESRKSCTSAKILLGQSISPTQHPRFISSRHISTSTTTINTFTMLCTRLQIITSLSYRKYVLLE